MKKRIDIVISEKRLGDNDICKKRYADTLDFIPTDRVPVIAGYLFWPLLKETGRSFEQMIDNPKEHMLTQILCKKWRMENVNDDLPIDTEKITIEPIFGALRGVEFPINIIWQSDDAPKSEHPIKKVEDIDTLQISSVDCGLNSKRISFYKQMKAMIEDYDIRLNGSPLNLHVDINHRGGPIPSAYALCGSNLLLWMKLDPERIHKLMEITTKSFLKVIEYFDEITGKGPGHSFWAGCDTGEMMSPEMFKEFVVPYYLKIWEKQGRPRSFHMCGKIDHLLDIIQNDFEIDVLEHFGFPTSKKLLAEKYSGRIVMRGGPHPQIIKDGPEETIIKECTDYINMLAPKGGFILSEGASIVPGTPLEHINTMVNTSRAIGNSIFF